MQYLRILQYNFLQCNFKSWNTILRLILNFFLFPSVEKTLEWCHSPPDCTLLYFKLRLALHTVDFILQLALQYIGVILQLTTLLYLRYGWLYIGVILQLAALLHQEEHGLQHRRHHLQVYVVQPKHDEVSFLLSGKATIIPMIKAGNYL